MIIDYKNKTAILTGKRSFKDILIEMDEATGCDFDDWYIEPEDLINFEKELQK